MYIIEWCNNNTGFLTGLLSLLTLAVSIIAVCVSIHTARIPYLKKLILSSDITVLFAQSNINGKILSQFSGITVNATNIGNRSVNIKFIGLAIRSEGKLQKMQTANRDLGGKGILSPTDVASVEYNAVELMDFGKLKFRTKVYCCVMDTEGKTYLKYYGRVEKIIRNLQEFN